MGTKGSKTPHRSTKRLGRMTQSADTWVWRPVSHPQTLNATFRVHIKHKLKKKSSFCQKIKANTPKKIYFSLKCQEHSIECSYENPRTTPEPRNRRWRRLSSAVLRRRPAIPIPRKCRFFPK